MVTRKEAKKKYSCSRLQNVPRMNYFCCPNYKKKWGRDQREHHVMVEGQALEDVLKVFERAVRNAVEQQQLR